MKNEQKHTPGPWKVSGYHRAIVQAETSIDGCNTEVAKMPLCMGPSYPNGYSAANARLIAAAPALLEACRLTARLIQEGLLPEEDCYGKPCEHCESFDECKVVAGVTAKVQAAIAKAEGKS